VGTDVVGNDVGVIVRTGLTTSTYVSGLLGYTSITGSTIGTESTTTVIENANKPVKQGESFSKIRICPCTDVSPPHELTSEANFTWNVSKST
jgi:hypothetical protein